MDFMSIEDNWINVEVHGTVYTDSFLYDILQADYSNMPDNIDIDVVFFFDELWDKEGFHYHTKTGDGAWILDFSTMEIIYTIDKDHNYIQDADGNTYRGCKIKCVNS